MTDLLNRVVQLGATGALVCAVMGLGAVPAKAAQPVIPTPAGVALLPNIIYVIPYAISSLSAAGGGPATETVVTIDGLASTATQCRFQVQWLDWNGAAAGVSGPTAIPAGGSFELVTLPQVGPSLFPYIPNVFSNASKPFEGYANVRTNCPTATRTGVDAAFVRRPSSTGGDATYKEIEPASRTGNLGD
jgi:hypothetical protein